MDQAVPETAAADTSSRQLAIAGLRKQQNLSLAVAGGIGVAIAAAIVWAIVTVVTKMELGIAAVAVGYAVGRTVKELGKGIDPVFGYLGAGCALLGCLLGNLFSAIAFYASAQNIPLSHALMNLDAALVEKLLTAFFQPMDLLFYGIAVYEGYRFSFKYKVR
jgi:hypothetical protein